jgi:excisionase family DNA binding protein
MAQLTVLEAARLVGRSKSHVFRAIRSGSLSAQRDDAGNYQIDQAELARVFQLTHLTQRGASDDLTRHSDDTAMTQLAARLADALDQVHDLRRRLDEAEAARIQADTERRQTAERLTALLTDQRAATPAAPASTRRAWWPWR